jgi:hypothetical protein
MYRTGTAAGWFSGTADRLIAGALGDPAEKLVQCGFDALDDAR